MPCNDIANCKIKIGIHQNYMEVNKARMLEGSRIEGLDTRTLFTAWGLGMRGIRIMQRIRANKRGVSRLKSR